MDNQGYTGFTFNGKHSSEFNIKRTSDGNRYNENFLPVIQDKTVQIPGADGTYFYGSYYTQKVFNVSFAFDSLTEEQLAALKSHFGDKKIHELIFDETPYKKYMAKVTGSATIKYIPFGEGATNRVYKGEGTLQFTAYDPYARAPYKFLNQYTPRVSFEFEKAEKQLKEMKNFGDIFFHILDSDRELIKKSLKELGYYIDIGGYPKERLLSAIKKFNLDNKIYINESLSEPSGEFKKETRTALITALTNHFAKKDEEWLKQKKEWQDAAGLLDEAGEFDALNTIIGDRGNKVSKENDKVEFPVYNPGDKESPLAVVFKFNGNKILGHTIELGEQFLEFAEITRKSGDNKATHIWFNGQTELVEGVWANEDKEYIRSGYVYNHCITKGNFLKVPLTKDKDSGSAPKVIVTPKFSKADDDNDDENEIKKLDKLNKVTGLHYEYYYL